MSAPHHTPAHTSPSDPRPATGKQLRYLRQLAQRTGQTFITPRSLEDASAEIRRLLKATKASNGFSFAELDSERHARERHADAPLYAPAIHESEIRGYGSNATWSQRS